MSHTPQDDAERIRLKRLAKLQNPPTASVSSSSASSPVPPVSPAPAPVASPKPKATPPPKLQEQTPPPAVQPPKRRVLTQPAQLDLPEWENRALSEVFKVTLNREISERSNYDLVWLKSLAQELDAEEPGISGPLQLHADIADRLLIARLEIDAETMSDDLEYLPVLASLPAQQTTFEYLIGCWKRVNAIRAALLKKGFPPAETQKAVVILDKLRELIVSYAGLTLQEPEMFPQPSGRLLGAAELLPSLLSLSALSTPLSASTSPSTTLTDLEVQPFLQDLSSRFTPVSELAPVLAPVVRLLCTHEGLARGLGGDAAWRGVIGGLEALVSVKEIAIMITTEMEDWCPESAGAAGFELQSLMGRVCRLGVFGREWPMITNGYFSDPEKRSRGDIESSYASLRGTLKSFQSSLFGIFNALVRASTASREAVLHYFSTAVKLNVKRGGSHVEPETVATDSFMVNLGAIMLRFAEPFMDAKYSKIDRIDSLYYAHSLRVDLKEETRIKATSEEANEWASQNAPAPGSPPPNFISDVYYLALALQHYGYVRTAESYDETHKQIDEMQRHLTMLQGDRTWMGTPFQARTEAAINAVQTEMTKIQSQQHAYRVQLLDPELVFRTTGFINFASTWLLRIVDPKKGHPSPEILLPLPNDVPMNFRVLPEYLLEDIVDYWLFILRNNPDSLELSGRSELVLFCLTFLTSTWYIKNPFLKAKINEVIFYGILPYGHERYGILGHILNTHPMALKHLMSALMHFYIEVEQTGASSQFYDKFNARRNIAYILKAIWDNPNHREALNKEALNVDKFVRFVNLMINDVTYLMDESLSELSQIHTIQTEMENKEVWDAKPLQYRREREGTLRQLERHASGYITLGNSTVGLLKDFTAETKAPFMMPEIVGRLAAMLDYNLDALVGPKRQDLVVKDREKYKFDPRKLLSEILHIFLNLSDQGEFVRAVADDGRSYKKELFERAAGIARNHALKTENEIEKLRLFVVKVEEVKATLEAEDDLGEVPDEFLDPLMFTVMRDPVMLPSSHTVVDRSTIKAHLLSDSKDPFNRVPLSIEDVIPDPELKEKIETFLQERRNKRTALDQDPETIMNIDMSAELMDTSPN